METNKMLNTIWFWNILKILIYANYYLDTRYMKKSTSADTSLQMAHLIGKSICIT